MNSYLSRTLALILSVLLFGFAGHAAENVANPQDKVMIDDFSRKFNLYWVDGDFTIHRNDHALAKSSANNFSDDTLYADESYVEQDYDASREGGNQFSLFYRGSKFVSYDSGYLTDGNSIYYQKCLKQQFDPSRGKNACIKFALYRDGQEISRIDYHDPIGFPAFHLLFSKSGYLFYEKPVENDKYATLIFDASLRKSTLFRSDLFNPTSPNDLVGILTNGNILYETSIGNLKANNFDVRLFHLNVPLNKSDLILDLGKSALSTRDGVVIGDHYYFRTDFGPTSLIKDDIQVTQQNSNTHGKIIDASKVACNLDATIHTYNTKMICIHPSGAIARIDSANAEIGKQLGGIDNPDSSPELFVNDKPLYLNSIRYLLADKSAEKAIEQISVAFNETGQVEFILFWVHSNSSWKDSIYISRYTKDAGLGTPILLKDDAQLFGVLAKKH